MYIFLVTSFICLRPVLGFEMSYTVNGTGFASLVALDDDYYASMTHPHKHLTSNPPSWSALLL